MINVCLEPNDVFTVLAALRREAQDACPTLDQRMRASALYAKMHATLPPVDPATVSYLEMEARGL